jgi:ketopantoate reductase
MFAFELAKGANVVGVSREKEVEMIKEKKLYVERKGDLPRIFEEKIIKDIEFQTEETPDIIFLAVKNPVSPVIKYYFQQLKDKGRLPTLLISQNGMAAISDAEKALREIFGEDSKKVRLVRLVLFNPIDQKKIDDNLYIKYGLPIRIALAKAAGPGGIKDIAELFERAGFQIKEFPQKEAKNLEYSKLFLNLIGMASASRGFSVKEGFKDKEVFKEEVNSLKEYIKAVKLTGGKFINFPNYPVKTLTLLLSCLPTASLLPFRNMIAKIVSSQREDKPKVLDEIDYYNGAIVNLGEKVGIKTSANDKIYKRIIERLQSS